MLKAFFDASRTEVQSGVYVIGGYVGTEPFWTEFEAEWRANLAYWEIPDFHLTDCLAGSREFLRLDSHKRQLCALSFGELIKRRKPDAIWSGVVDDDWKDLAANEAFRARYPSPYQFMFEDIIWQLARWGRSNAPGEMIAPVFDSDAKPDTVEPIYRGLKQSPLYDNLVCSVTFGGRRAFVPIQAADIMAGEMRRHWFDREFPADPVQFWPEWRNLLDYATPNGSTGGLWTPDSLRRAADAYDRSGDPFNWPVQLPSEKFHELRRRET